LAKVTQLSSSEKKRPASQALVAHICNCSYSGGKNKEDLSLGPAQAMKTTLYLKMPDKKRADRKARVVEHLPIKYEARVQTPVPPKKKKKKTCKITLQRA
jgi:hypothetical protein